MRKHFRPVRLAVAAIDAPSLKEAHKHLLEVADIVRLIGQRLRKRGAAYAPVLEAIASLVSRNIDEQSPANSNLEDRDDTPAALDAAWEESPVTFNDAALPASQLPVTAASQSRLTKRSESRE